MTRSEFQQLKVGDRVYHPDTGTREIVEVEFAWEYSTGKPVRYTWAITVTGGNRMKIDDAWDVPRLRRAA